MGISVVIPNWNGGRLLEPLFADLAAQTLPVKEILVVDNGSGDGSPDWAEAHGARVIRYTENRGFASAVNAGVGSAGTELVAVLNNDVRLRPDWLEAVEAGRGGSAWAVGKILNAADPTLIDGTFDALCCGGTACRCGYGQPDGPLWSCPRAISFPPFTAVLLQRSVFLECGGLDEAFESYLEDVEFGLRCASKGHTGQYVPSAVSFHAGSATLGRWHPRTVRQLSRNQVFLLARHYRAAALIRFGWKIAIAQGLWGVVAARHGQLAPWLAGKTEGLLRFRELRKQATPVPDSILLASEEDLRQYCTRRSCDRYWRLYFQLT